MLWVVDAGGCRHSRNLYTQLIMLCERVGWLSDNTPAACVLAFPHSLTQLSLSLGLSTNYLSDESCPSGPHAGLLVLPVPLLTQRLQATLDLLQLPAEAGKGLVVRAPGVLLQPPGVTRSHVLGLSAVLNIPLVRPCEGLSRCYIAADLLRACDEW